MLFAFSEQRVSARRRRGPFGEAPLWASAFVDAVTIGPKEHLHVISQDLRYAFRAMAANPAFTAVAVLSLALGIGANTAVFSVWNRVLAAALPVPVPGQLVILSNPDASGLGVGQSGGERGLLTYEEYEQLRDHADVFAGVMASESSLERLPARFAGGPWTEIRGRMVTGTYFEVLGVQPLMGRFLTSEDDQRDSPFVVLGYDYWQRALGGNPEVIGRAITIRKAALTVIGVAQPDFAGETTGQRPDMWISMRNQAAVAPGLDRLRGTGPDKVMWLHVFARLKPGVTIAQAQTAANVIFQNGLRAFYARSLSPETARAYLDQRLVARSAALGASNIRSALTSPLTALRFATGVILLIACFNVANLLLARGASRQHEIALRLSLGANRSRIARQLLTESLALAALGGIAGLVAAYAFNRALVFAISMTNETFHVAFGIDSRVLLFSAGITLTAAIVFGLLPAWLATRATAPEEFRNQGRSTSASTGQLRWGRALVGLQLALCLPLVAAAGLLARSLTNLSNADLGYLRDRLLVTRANLGLGGVETHRREPMARRIRDEIRRITGVLAVSYSENGLFSGTDSGDEIEVEGYLRSGKDDRGSRWDQVGPGYFATVGMPLILGRDIAESDHAGAPKVCVINESFAMKFFNGRNPLGMGVTQILGDQRTTHRVVGVAKDGRTHRIRGEIDPRYFAPLTQPLGEFGGVVFETRVTGDPAPVARAIQEVIRRVDPAIDIQHNETVDSRVSRRVAQDQILAALAACFGAVALALAAVGLYGVLAYGVTQRRVEIGIRIALGAERARVIGMILREAAAAVLGGLVIGSGLTYAGMALIRSQLFGLEPSDPATLTAAAVALVAVALAAAFLPAWRAARIEPLVALRQD